MMSPREQRLERALRDLVARCDGEPGVQPDGSNIDTLAAHEALGDLTPPDVFRCESAAWTQERLEAVARDNGITITIEMPWAGDFGSTGHIVVSRETASEFANWLITWSRDDRTTGPDTIQPPAESNG